MAFLLTKKFVFKASRNPIYVSVLIFTVVNIVAAIQTWAISLCMLYFILPSLNVSTFAPEIAHGLGVVTPVFTSYFGHKYFSFR